MSTESPIMTYIVKYFIFIVKYILNTRTFFETNIGPVTKFGDLTMNLTR